MSRVTAITTGAPGTHANTTATSMTAVTDQESCLPAVATIAAHTTGAAASATVTPGPPRTPQRQCTGTATVTTGATVTRSPTCRCTCAAGTAVTEEQPAAATAAARAAVDAGYSGSPCTAVTKPSG